MTGHFYHDNAVQLVTERADIVEVVGEHVSLSNAGANLKGLCPFHVEKTASFHVSPAKQNYKCYGCGEGGNVITFLMKYHNYSFPEALKELAHRYHVPLKGSELSPEEKKKARLREKLMELNEEAASLYNKHLTSDKQAEVGRRYLTSRSMDDSIVNEFRLGYAPRQWDFLIKKLSDSFSESLLFQAGLIVRSKKGTVYDRFRSRVLFPIFNHKGRIVGFGGRIVGEGEPKYLNTSETPIFNKGKILFGFYQNKEEIRRKGQALVVEGNFDLLALAAAGLRNVVAPLGTAFTVQHIKAIKGCAREAVLLFDGDEAGIKAALRATPHLLAEKMKARVVVLPGGHDPDSYIREFGLDKLEKNIKEAVELSEFVLKRLTEQYGLSLEGKAKIIEELQPVINALEGNSVERELFVTHFSQRLGISSEYLLRGKMGGNRNRPAPVEKIREKGKMPTRNRQLLQFIIHYPEYFDSFIDAGMGEVFHDQLSEEIFILLKAMAENTGIVDPEFLLESLQPSAERTFIADTLIDFHCQIEENKEAEAQEKLAWLKKYRLQNKKEDIMRKIGEVQKTDNFSLLLELLKEKKSLDQDFQT